MEYNLGEIMYGVHCVEKGMARACKLKRSKADVFVFGVDALLHRVMLGV